MNKLSILRFATLITAFIVSSNCFADWIPLPDKYFNEQRTPWLGWVYLDSNVIKAGNLVTAEVRYEMKPEKVVEWSKSANGGKSLYKKVTFDCSSGKEYTSAFQLYSEPNLKGKKIQYDWGSPSWNSSVANSGVFHYLCGKDYIDADMENRYGKRKPAPTPSNNNALILEGMKQNNNYIQKMIEQDDLVNDINRSYKR